MREGLRARRDAMLEALEAAFPDDAVLAEEKAHGGKLPAPDPVPSEAAQQQE